MRIISRSTIVKFYTQHPNSKSSLESWYHEVKNAALKSPAEVKMQYGNASIVGGNRVVFNICGNKYRLVVKIEYKIGIIFIRFVGSHGEYDKIDVGMI